MTEEVQQQTEQAPAQEKGADLNINDLNALKQIIDVASSRGAFKPGNEMVAVGQVYEKLSSFLEAVAKQAEASKEKTGV
jgi:hypothetical protein